MTHAIEKTGVKASCPVVVAVNVDVETVDLQVASGAGLYGRYSYGRYGAREGLWRLLNVLADEGVKGTFFVPGSDAERHPSLVEEIHAAGHEIAAQGAPVSEKAPRDACDHDLVEKTRDTLASITGLAPTGWRSSNGLVTADLLRLLPRMGFTYDMSFQDDDWPYVFDADDSHALVELPIWDYLTDSTFYGDRHSHLRVGKVWAEEFAAISGAGGYVPLVLHSRGDIGSGRAVRAQTVADFIRQMKRHSGVRFYRGKDLAAEVQAGTVTGEPIPDW